MTKQSSCRWTMIAVVMFGTGVALFTFLLAELLALPDWFQTLSFCNRGIRESAT